MTKFDVTLLKRWLDENEEFANGIYRDDARYNTAQEMLGVIFATRVSLITAPDTTQDFLAQKEMLEQLAALRDEAEKSQFRRADAMKRYASITAEDTNQSA